MTSLCKSCGKEIVFAKNFDTGRLLPLEQVKVAYVEIAAMGDGEMTVQKSADAIFISHFTTCPEASKFSKKEKKP